MNSDERRQARLRRRRERRAAESSEERETRLARRRVADSLLPLVASVVIIMEILISSYAYRAMCFSDIVYSYDIILLYGFESHLYN